MTQYNFIDSPNRLSQHAEKWRKVETDKELLPLWIADMDFEPLPEIRQVIRDYADHHVFGYPYASDSLYQSIIDWEDRQHGYKIERESILLIEGVVPALSVAIQSLTEEGDAVLINTPVYPPFARTVKLNNRQLVTNSLVDMDDVFRIDFDQLEKDIVENQVKLYIFCNPHNPGGRVWTREEVLAIGCLCQKHGVILVSDEIHQDLTLYGHKHYSFNTVDESFKEFSIILSSATKTFNIAGTKNSFAIIENPSIRKTFAKRQLINNQHEIPTIGLLTTEAAFTYGDEWLKELKVILERNIDFVEEYLATHTRIKVMKPQGTYLIWLDFSAYELEHAELFDILHCKAKLILNDGLTFGKEGKYHARLNVAAPFNMIEEACQRLGKVFG
ncbi:MalY/PatB family protein [Streptococcus suis]|uniref:cysteine-S-conjugate beta-lyase n=1 Tax=Streptococcus suis TaxID=1307 RepID=A0AB33UEE5_STRSU|nr:MalY/PatB family protein [Streptococcus suis]NQN58070.1 pyridoxal phosphate-dependent aminotransferase [Streptococcus suis]NQS30919.1 pyridoxal phosphate-dependent aminotransferase [Streptococcus suis]NQS51945.1 pyridoxal phosphate-dependent aminotransferase [Streptococcus suis]CYW97746.1 bifunctional beta-cystathionase/maltose regulon repressor [Streptococcus suis]CYX88413.1 bifunctional beta-cystathionase/maltose regulon repressor [Streptococcus suis]